MALRILRFLLLLDDRWLRKLNPSDSVGKIRLRCKLFLEMGALHLRSIANEVEDLSERIAVELEYSNYCKVVGASGYAVRRQQCAEALSQEIDALLIDYGVIERKVGMVKSILEEFRMPRAIGIYKNRLVPRTFKRMVEREEFFLTHHHVTVAQWKYNILNVDVCGESGDFEGVTSKALIQSSKRIIFSLHVPSDSSLGQPRMLFVTFGVCELPDLGAEIPLTASVSSAIEVGSPMLEINLAAQVGSVTYMGSSILNYSLDNKLSCRVDSYRYQGDRLGFDTVSATAWYDRRNLAAVERRLRIHELDFRR